MNPDLQAFLQHLASVLPPDMMNLVQTHAQAWNQQNFSQQRPGQQFNPGAQPVPIGNPMQPPPTMPPRPSMPFPSQNPGYVTSPARPMPAPRPMGGMPGMISPQASPFGPPAGSPGGQMPTFPMGPGNPNHPNPHWGAPGSGGVVPGPGVNLRHPTPTNLTTNPGTPTQQSGDWKNTPILWNSGGGNS